ncbi:MAG: hypothetical protein ACREEB_06745 [Caulobacteraceae bacterium]
MTDATLVTWACLIAGAICFVLYVAEAIVTIATKPAAAAAADTATPHLKAHAAAVMAKADFSVDDLTKVLDSTSKLTDSLAKAGPALTSLVGAILFFAIAALSSGALHGGAQSANPAPATAASSAK